MTAITLTNIVPNGSFEQTSAWSGATYDTSQHVTGSRSQKLPAGGAQVATAPTAVIPVAGHIYYGRHYIKTAGNNTPADCRFEWFAGDGAGLNFVFGWNRGNHPDWYMESTRMQISQVNGASYIIRSFTVNGTADMWADGLMLLDLTAAFGAGKEPDKDWCDTFLPYIEGSMTVQVEMSSEFKIISASISPNPASINSKATISVMAAEQERCDLIDPYYHAGEIFCGEI